MRKRLTKDGNSHKLRITKEEMDLYGLVVDDIIDFTITDINSKPIKRRKNAP